MPDEFDFLDDEQETPVESAQEAAPQPQPRQDAPTNRRDQDQQRFQQQLQQERQQYAPQGQVDPVDAYIDSRAESRAQQVAQATSQQQVELAIAVMKTEQKYPELANDDMRGWVGTTAQRLAQNYEREGRMMPPLESLLDEAAQLVKSKAQTLVPKAQPLDRMAVDMGVGNGTTPPASDESKRVEKLKAMTPMEREALRAKIYAKQYV